MIDFLAQGTLIFTSGSVRFWQGRVSENRLENKWLNTAVGCKSVPWYGDVFAIKISEPDGRLLDMDNLDLVSASDALVG